MSSAVRKYHASLFGNEERSDCIIKFTLSRDEADRPSKRRKLGADAEQSDGGAVGQRLPGHTILLCPGSSFFNSQAERWASDQPAGARLELRVPLGSVDDLPFTQAAIRFIYTDKLDVSGAADLLNVRRLASFLGVEGCVEACGAALLDLARAPSAQPLAGVADLYRCRHLLPGPDEDPGAAALLDELYKACRDQLATNAYTPERQGCGQAKLGELLAWAFRDAPTALNDSTAKAQALSLSASALEALLSSDAFATDDEASVLLLLAEWLAAKPSTTTEVRTKLCHQIRLCQLSSAYLHAVMPAIAKTWFPLSKRELSLVHQCASLPSGGTLRERFLELVDETRTSPLPPAWFSAPARPKARSDVGRPNDWTISREALVQVLARATVHESLVPGTFTHGPRALVANGFHWHPVVSIARDSEAAGLYLDCHIPPALRVEPYAVEGFASPGLCRLVVFEWEAAGRPTEAFVYVAGTRGKVGIGIGERWGYPDGLPLAPLQTAEGRAGATRAAAASSVEQWERYLHKGQLHGCLTWMAEEEDEEP
ncbi:hypothetical protein HYH03_004501 [Edaphochlamys debaryana]|uniref:BACK domain-containing protein n=1 Tax=Edaphochlamys debaryana TaxID=47281 RepID=A0A835Y6W5_9CHLO|nr:hypothetical protein HYH03_004501 [Edaphochlamys debaryana]|eukprot:KAG2497340.1 hypothetical protein HYH03_004501 [Edaphochlamys debaryana]